MSKDECLSFFGTSEDRYILYANIKFYFKITNFLFIYLKECRCCYILSIYWLKQSLFLWIEISNSSLLSDRKSRQSLLNNFFSKSSVVLRTR